MKAARQFEPATLVRPYSSIIVAHAQARLKAASPEQQADLISEDKERNRTPLQQMVKLGGGISQATDQKKEAESSKGLDPLNCKVAEGDLTKLLVDNAMISFC